MAVIERFGGCCHGENNSRFPNCDFVEEKVKQCVVREKAKSGINTVTEVLSSQ